MMDHRLKHILFRIREYMIEQDPKYKNIHVKIEVRPTPGPNLEGSNMSMELVEQHMHDGFIYTTTQELDDATPRDT